jgi:hypothetical protein
MESSWVRNATKFFVKGTEYPHTGTYNLHFEKEAIVVVLVESTI